MVKLARVISIGYAFYPMDSERCCEDEMEQFCCIGARSCAGTRVRGDGGFSKTKASTDLDDVKLEEFPSHCRLFYPDLFLFVLRIVFEIVVVIFVLRFPFAICREIRFEICV